jgi:CRISPR-associated protein (TIGR03984 family)
MEEALYAGPVTVKDFPQLVKDCKFSDDAFVLVEQLPARVVEPDEQKSLLRFESFDPDFPFANYTSGRVFDTQAELRWEKRGETMQAVYLGANKPARDLLKYGLHNKDELAVLKHAGEREYVLFGERLRSDDLEKIGPAAQTGDFAEVRIPRILRYPVPQDEQPYARLTVREYLDEQNSIVLFRFQNLKSWSPRHESI